MEHSITHIFLVDSSSQIFLSGVWLHNLSIPLLFGQPITLLKNWFPIFFPSEVPRINLSNLTIQTDCPIYWITWFVIILRLIVHFVPPVDQLNHQSVRVRYLYNLLIWSYSQSMWYFVWGLDSSGEHIKIRWTNLFLCHIIANQIIFL